MSRLHMGIDVGSTTVKVVVLDENNNTLFAEYRRHFSDIKSTVKGLFAEVKEVVKNEQFTVVITGSGGLLLSKMLDLPFVQEVIANKTAIKTFMPETDVVIELGGEDAKILYLSGGLEQRMNGTCAGGTGSFIDQMSILLKTDADGLNALAENHTIIYPIAARCGVFAKSDVQPLLNEGAAREDIAASILQAVVTQTISGLAQGRPIKGNIVFLGGPLHFLPQLRRQFEETLKDNAKSFKTPENAQLFVAIGAALMYEDKTSDIDTLISQLANAKSVDAEITRMRKLFETEEERKEFFDRHGKDVARRKDISTANGPVFLGLDVGSTTIKAALINEDGDILYDYYGKNEGSPITCEDQARAAAVDGHAVQDAPAQRLQHVPFHQQLADGGAFAAVDERLESQPPPLEQQADAVQAVELVGRQAHGVHALKGDGDLAHGLGGVYVQMAVGPSLQNFRNSFHRLHDAQLTVHQCYRYSNGVGAEKLFQVLEVDGAVPPDVHEVDFIALLLQSGQGAADGGVFQRGGDDVLAQMAGEFCQPLESKVVGLAGSRGIDDLGGLCAQQPRDALGGVVDDQFCVPACLMAGVRVAGAAALYLTKTLQHPGVCGGVGRIIQIYHKCPSIISGTTAVVSDAAGPVTNCGNRLYYSAECGIFQGCTASADRKSPQNTGKRLSASFFYAILCRRMKGKGRAGC